MRKGKEKKRCPLPSHPNSMLRGRINISPSKQHTVVIERSCTLGVTIT
jgi:hypothetical protein